MTVGAQLRVRTDSGGFSLLFSPDRRDVTWISLPKSNSISFPIKRHPKWVSCNSSSNHHHLNAGGGDHDQFFESSLLVSETFWHYRSLRKGFREDIKWQPFTHLPPFSVQATGPRPDLSLMAHGFLRRFPNPTMFLKIACDGDFLLPISVGEFAIEKLVDSSRRDNSGGCPDQYQFVCNVAEDLGYQVKMVKITQRVVNTYFAKLCFSKAGENEILSVDMRPSDAINVAYRCKAPIYVSKQVLLADAIRISYGMGRPHSRKSTYDVTLDSAADGPDLLSEEFLLVKNMNLSAQEERYNDAAMWRDKLTNLRKSEH